MKGGAASSAFNGLGVTPAGARVTLSVTASNKASTQHHPHAKVDGSKNPRNGAEVLTSISAP